MQFSHQKVGVFVDAQSIASSGGYGMRFDVLRDFAARDIVGQPLLLNAYVAYPDESEPDRITKAQNFQATLREFGYRVVEVDEKDVTAELGAESCARSALLDRVLIATADVDVLPDVRSLVNRGLRVELVGFQDVPPELSDEVDLFMSGYLVPNLLPVRGGQGKWGEEGSRVRGICYSFSHDRGFGFIRYMSELGDLSVIDTRDDDSPYRSAFCHESELPACVGAEDLPSREFIFEFTLVESDRGLQARDIVAIDTHG